MEGAPGTGHRAVLVSEVLDLLKIVPGGCYVDATVGAGGHAEAILRRAGPGGRLLGVDWDEDALERAARRLGPWMGQVRLVRANFAELSRVAREAGFEGVDGVLMDLGVSSEQLEAAARGFSFQAEGPLDMRMDRRLPVTAAELVNGLAEEELCRLLKELGEEPAARRIARALVRERARAPIRDTVTLARLVERAKGGRRGRTHPATATFRALRMAVNRELENLERGLSAALEILRAGGRLAVIAFHSLEDRCVKEFGRRHAGRWVGLPAGGRRWEGERPRVVWVTRKPVVPGARERAENPRSRSAKLRVMEKVNNGAKEPQE